MIIFLADHYEILAFLCPQLKIITLSFFFHLSHELPEGMYPQGRVFSCIVVLVELRTYYGARKGHGTRAVEANHDRKESIYSNNYTVYSEAI